MTVYRVEHGETGNGPYREYLAQSEIHDDEEHPVVPRDVMVLCEMLGAMFGFTSVKQAARWFGRDIRRALRGAGFVLVKLSVPDRDVIYTDEYQVVFVPSRARLIGVAA